MEDVFGLMGQAILAAIATGGIVTITYWLFFGFDGKGGPLGNYLLAALGMALGA